MDSFYKKEKKNKYSYKRKQCTIILLRLVSFDMALTMLVELTQWGYEFLWIFDASKKEWECNSNGNFWLHTLIFQKTIEL